MSWEIPDLLVYVGSLVAFAGVGGFIYTIVSSEDNELEWWHFIATKAVDGKHYADVDKLGKVVALLASTMVVVWMGYQNKLDALLLGTYLGFAGGIAGYSAYLRAKKGGDTDKP